MSARRTPMLATLGVVLVGAAFSGCKTQTAEAADERGKGNSLAPPKGERLEELSLDDGSVAYVVAPAGATEPRPLIVGVHGANEHPESACKSWHRAASGYAFVVCPHGVKVGEERFAWDSDKTIAARVGAAITAVRFRFEKQIAHGPTIYAGFSQGATLARTTLLEQEGRFPVVLLAEGAYDLLSDPGFLSRLRARGTERVALVCGEKNCFTAAEARKPVIERQGLTFVVVGSAESGHQLDERMQHALQKAWPDLVADLPNWRGYQKVAQSRSRIVQR